MSAPEGLFRLMVKARKAAEQLYVAVRRVRRSSTPSVKRRCALFVELNIAFEIFFPKIDEVEIIRLHD